MIDSAGGGTGIDCPACGPTGWLPLLSVGDHRYVRCRTCPTARLDLMPAPAELAAVFSESYFVEGGDVGGYLDYAADEQLHRRNAADRLRLVEAAGARPEHGPWVEVGCATGETIAAAADAGWAVHGVEIADWAATRVTARGLPVVPTLDDLTGATAGPARPSPDLTGSCGVVAFFQSLEHLPDPAAALRTAARLLAPGGLVIIETWDRGSAVARLSGRFWQQLSPPSVLWLFHRRAAAGMAGRAGLTQLAWRSTGKSVTVGFAAGLLAARYPATRLPLRPLLHGRPGRLAVRYRLGDLVTATLRRPG
jgi:SAM-dependent methyltransferase